MDWSLVAPDTLPWLLGGAVGFICLIYGLISFTVHYHWRNYGFDEKIIRLTLVSYYAISLPLLGVTLLSALSIWSRL
jgi:hypothetical protein